MKNSALSNKSFILLLFISICSLLIISSCSFSIFNNYKTTCKHKFNEQNLKPVFIQDTLSHLYKAKFHIYKKYFSGLMVFRNMPSGNSRVVFMSEMGLKFFDFEFSKPNNENKTGFTIHYCMEAINKKMLINILRNDFGLIIMNNLKSSELVEMKEKGTLNKVLKLKIDKRHNFYIFDKETARMTNIKQTSCLFKKVKIDLFQQTDNIPDSIKISHYNLKLKIDLNLIKN